MNLGSRFLSLLLLPLVFQSPQDRLKQHYEVAEAQARAGNFAAAETEYTAILAEGYRAIGCLSTQQSHKSPIARYPSQDCSVFGFSRCEIACAGLRFATS